MRILMVNDHFLPYLGGIERVILEVGRRLIEKGHRVQVLTFRLQPHWPSEQNIAGIEVHRCPLALGHPLATYLSAVGNIRRRFGTLAGQCGYDVLHFHMTLSSLGVLLSPESRQIPKVFTFYGPAAEEYRFQAQGKQALLPYHMRPLYGLWARLNTALLRRLQRYAVSRSDAVVVLSDYSRSQLAEVVPGWDGARVHRIWGGVDTAKFRPAEDRSALKAHLGLPADGFVLFTVRRLVPRMGLEALVEATAGVIRRFPQVHLVIGGAGMLEGHLRALVASLGLEGRVHVEGFIPDERLPAYYQAADLFVMPTAALEGFGLPVIEALACGTPVLGTAVGAIQETLGGLGQELLVPPREAAALEAGIGAFIERWAGSAELRRRCRQYAVENYSWDRLVPQYEALYASLAAPRALAGVKGTSAL